MVRCRGLRARAGPGPLVCPVSGRALACLWLFWLVVTGGGLLVVAVAGQGGPAASPARVLRRRSALCQCRVTWSRKALTALALPGTA